MYPIWSRRGVAKSFTFTSNYYFKLSQIPNIEKTLKQLTFYSIYKDEIENKMARERISMRYSWVNASNQSYEGLFYDNNTYAIWEKIIITM